MSLSKPDIALSPSWRPAALRKASVPQVVTLSPKNGAGAKPHGAVSYTQASGADVFPGRDLIRAVFKKLRRA